MAAMVVGRHIAACSSAAAVPVFPGTAIFVRAHGASVSVAAVCCARAAAASVLSKSTRLARLARVAVVGARAGSRAVFAVGAVAVRATGTARVCPAASAVLSILPTPTRCGAWRARVRVLRGWAAISSSILARWALGVGAASASVVLGAVSAHGIDTRLASVGGRVRVPVNIGCATR